MIPELELSKVLWLKHNMPAGLFSRCSFYDLKDALTHMACGNELRPVHSSVGREDRPQVGVDGAINGWSEDFISTIGLQELTRDGWSRIGGIDKVLQILKQSQ